METVKFHVNLHRCSVHAQATQGTIWLLVNLGDEPRDSGFTVFLGDDNVRTLADELTRIAAALPAPVEPAPAADTTDDIPF